MYNWLWAGRFGDRIPVGTKISSPVQTRPEAHPTSYTMGTGSFLGIKRPGRHVDHTHPSSAEVKERIEFTSKPSVFILGFRVNFTLISALCPANMDGIRAMYRVNIFFLFRNQQSEYLGTL